MTRAQAKTKAVRSTLTRKKSPSKPPTDADFLGTGSTLLDLACSNRVGGAFLKGHYYFFVGDSGSGKTWATMSIMAEASINPNFAKHRLIHDNPEHGALMDLQKFFGKALADRLEEDCSTSLEGFYRNFTAAMKKGPCVYILDSLDALPPEVDLERFDTEVATHEKGEKVTKEKSYGTERARINSDKLRMVVSLMKTSGSILILISQTRDNIGTNSIFNPKTRGGGNAPTFFATLEMWTSVKGKIKKSYNDKDRLQGVYCRVRIKKNRLTGRDRSVIIPIYHSHGIDDTGACIDWLIEEKHWKKKPKSTLITATEFNWRGSREALIRKIEDNNKEKQLHGVVAKVWDKIEQAISIQRKNRYVQ